MGGRDGLEGRVKMGANQQGRRPAQQDRLKSPRVGAVVVMLVVNAVTFLLNTLHPARASPWRTLACRVLVNALQGGLHVWIPQQRVDERGCFDRLKGGKHSGQLKRAVCVSLTKPRI